MKITLLGGGSYAWTPKIMGDFATSPLLADDEVVLYDIAPEPLELVGSLAQRMVEATGSRLRVSCTTCQKDALDGADFVVITISTGGLDAMQVDLEVPERYGIRQTVGDTVGPGGFSRALRNVPVFVELGRAMQEHCPDAWMLNCSNPLTTLTRAVCRETGIKALGLCHGVVGFMKSLGPVLGFESLDEIDFVSSGIDHCGWLLQLNVKGRDGFDLFRDKGLGPGGEAALCVDAIDDFIPDTHIRVGFLIFSEVGYLPTIGDRHIVEFFPHFLHDPATMDKLGLVCTTVDERRENRRKAEAQLRSMLSGDTPIEPKLSSDVVLESVLALSGRQPANIGLNAPNVGQVPNLPEDAIVDTWCWVTEDYVQPLCAGPLPPVLQTLVEGHLVRQEMSIDAALSGDRQIALEGLVTDPLVQDMTCARAMLEELLEGNRRHLPAFSV